MTLRPSLDRRTAAWLVYAAAGVAALAAFLVLPPATLPQSVLYDAVALSSALAILLGVWVHRPATPWPWLLMAAGLLSFFVGDVIWVVHTLRGEDMFPSAADLFYLSGYPFLAAGLLLGIRSRLRGGDRSGLLDASILTTSVTILAWTIQIGPMASTLDPEPLAFGISLAYPIADLLLIGVGIGLLATPGSRTVSFRLIALSLLVLLVADQVYAIQAAEGTYVNGAPLDAAWILSYVLWGAAALHPSMARLFEPRPVAVALLGPIRMLFLLAALLTGPALLVLAGPAPSVGLAVIAAGSSILAVLVVVRLSGLVRMLSADIAKRRVLEAELSFQANHDALTGLMNRRLFVASVESAFEHLADGSSPIALVFLDLDDFKTVNDSMGHDAGDRMLVAVAARIRGSLRARDIAARLGGDEFALLLQPVNGADEAAAITARVIDTLDEPLVLDGQAMPVAASAGIVLAAPGTRSVDELLRAADVAMYAAKARGKNRYQVYGPELEPAEVAPGTPAAHRIGGRQPAAT